LSEESIGKNRLSETISKLKELNDECDIKEHTKEITEEFLSQFTVNFNFFNSPRLLFTQTLTLQKFKKLLKFAIKKELYSFQR
jgi:hypothetical protein